MDEDIQATENTEEAHSPDQPAAVEPAPSESPAAQESPADWRTYIDTADPDELRRHPKVAGIVGRIVEKERERINREADEKKAAEAAQKAEEELLRLAEDEPLVFAEKYLTKHFEQKAKGEFETVGRI